MLGVFSLLLAACAIAPEGTSFLRIMRTLHHADHPEYVRAPARGGDFVEFSEVGEAQWRRDGDECRRTTRATTDYAYRAELWDCAWAKGWRWDADAPPRKR